MAGYPGLPSRFSFLRARVWLVVILLASVGILVGLHLAMSYLELGWCDDRTDRPGACKLVRAPFDWFNTKVVGAPDEASCATPLADLRQRGARVWITDGAFLADGGVMLAARFAMKRGAVPQKLARLLPDGRPDPSFEPGQDCAPSFRLFRPFKDGTVALIGGAPDGADDLTRVTTLTAAGMAKTVRARGVCGAASGNIRDAVPDGRGGLWLAGNFESGSEIALLARLEADGRCVLPFEPSPEPVTPEAIAGVGSDGSIVLRLRPPQELPLMRYQANGSVDINFSLTLQQSMTEAGLPFPLDAEMASDGTIVLTFPPEIGLPTVAWLDQTGRPRDTRPTDPEALDRRIADARPQAGGAILLSVDGRSRETAETLRVPPARLWRLLPDGSLDIAFAAATKDLAVGAGDLRVLDIAPDGRLLVLALWYGVPPGPYSWPWPVKNELHVLDRDGRRLAGFDAPPF